jgi:hemerythrin-like domain-containing protein
MTSRAYFGPGNTLPGNGPLCRMVMRETESLAASYDRFRDAWDRRDVLNASIAFELFREALSRHIQWEEDCLFEEWEKRCTVPELKEVRQHHRQHELADRLTERVERLLRRRLGLGAALDDELVVAIFELENLLKSHERAELHEVCCRLDAILSDVELGEIHAELAVELEERGRPKH